MPDSRSRYRESRRHCLRGLGLLAAGSALLLCKMVLPGFAGLAAAVLGGFLLLLGNGLIIYRLLVFSDSRGA